MPNVYYSPFHFDELMEEHTYIEEVRGESPCHSPDFTEVEGMLESILDCGFSEVQDKVKKIIHVGGE